MSKSTSRAYSASELSRLHDLLVAEGSLLSSQPKKSRISRSLSSRSSGGGFGVARRGRHQKYECIEALRAISEIVVWADHEQANASLGMTEGSLREDREDSRKAGPVADKHSAEEDQHVAEEANAIVDMFLSRQMVKYFHEVLVGSADDDDVIAQVLQTMSILIQNLRNAQTVYCVFSNNHVNEILCMDELFLMGEARAAGVASGPASGLPRGETQDALERDEQLDTQDDGFYDRGEVLRLYVNLLKTVVMRLDQVSVEFFLRDGRVCVPYVRALRVGELDVMREDGMVRAAVRAVVLKLYSIVPDGVEMGGDRTVAFFWRLKEEMMGGLIELERLLRAWYQPIGGSGCGGCGGGKETHRIEALLGQFEDDMAFFSDVIRTGRAEVVEVMLREVWPQIILRSLHAFQEVGALGGVRSRARVLTALLALEAVCKALSCPNWTSLMGLLVSLLLTGDSAKAAARVVDELGVSMTVDELIGKLDRKAMRGSVLSCLKENGNESDASCRLVLLRLLAVMLDDDVRGGIVEGEVDNELLASVGLMSIGERTLLKVSTSMNVAVENEQQEALASSKLDSGQLFETEFSVCFSERCNELQGAIFDAVICNPTVTSRNLTAKTQMLTYATWILLAMLLRGGGLGELPIARLQELLARTHDAMLLCLPSSEFAYAAPMMLNHCWNVQQQHLLRLSPRQEPSKLTVAMGAAGPSGAAGSGAETEGGESLRMCLDTITHFVAAHQLYCLVVKGKHEVPSHSPFPEGFPGLETKAGHGTTHDNVFFRTSAGALELGTEDIVVRDESGVALFEAPLPTVTLLDSEAGESPRHVSLISAKIEISRGRMRVKSTMLRGVSFETRLERGFVDNAVRTAKKSAKERSRGFLELCVANM